MPAKIAVGKSTTVSYPAAGTIKSSTGLTATSMASVQSSKQSNPASSTKIEKEDEAGATEIVAIADFNRVFDSSKTFTPYGEYYRALDAVHAVTTDDITYIVNTAIEKDAGGQWTTLRDAVETNIADADDLNNDLAAVDVAIEQASKSLNFLRMGDTSLQEEAEKFLADRLKSYETPAASRTIDIDSILYTDLIGTPPSERFSSTGGGVDALKEMLRDISWRIIEPPDKTCFEGLGQTQASKDLNPTSPSGVAWDYIDIMTRSSTSPGVRLYRCAEMISYVLGISTGIRKVEQDPIASRISFSRSKLSSIFEGIGDSSPVPYRRSKNSANYGESLIAMSLVQFDSSKGEIVVPVEFEDSPSKTYRSGVKSLIREPIMDGEYSFSDFSSYIAAFEDARQDIENYSEIMLGLLDPENNLTPMGILRIIVESFIEGLEKSKTSESSKFQLMYTSIAGTASDGTSKSKRQRLLQIAGRIKYYQLKRGESSPGSGDDAAKKTTLVTTLVSEGSESLKSDATPTTTQTQDKSDAATERVIVRTAAASAPSDKLSLSMTAALFSNAAEGGLTAATIQSALDSAKDVLTVYTADRERFKTYAKNGSEEYRAKFELYKSLCELEETYIANLQEQLANTPDYVDTNTVSGYFEEAMKTTDGTFFSCMLKAYDDIVDAALKRLPDNVKMTDDLGKTLHGAFDEFGLLSLIVECFVALASPLKLSVQKSDAGSNPPIFDDDFEFSINADDLVQDLEDALRNTLPSIAVMGYSTADVSSYIDELRLLTSSEQTPETLAELTFVRAASVKYAFELFASRAQRYQNAFAYLNAFSKVMSLSKDDLIAAFSNIFETSSRRDALDNTNGRKMMSSLTNQQMVYRRSLLDKYRASSTYGYLPARFIYSEFESNALNDLLSSADYSSKLAENTRLVVAAVPAGTISDSVKYNDPDLGAQNYTGMIELVMHRRDHELDDLIFKEKVFLFDPQLYVMPDSFVSYARSRGSSTSDPALQIAKKLSFKLYSRDEVKVLSYQDFSSQERYQNLTSDQINQILRNTTLSYLLETYLFKTTGMVFDESITLNLDDSISDAGLSALTSIAGQNLPDLVLPNSEQLNLLINDNGEVDYFADIPNMSTGDRELISALKSSYIMRNEKPVDRLLSNCNFDRVFIVAVDPDSFSINESETTGKNGDAGRQMLVSLQKQGLLKKVGSNYTIIPRDPLTGGFSIGDVSCQFIPHTANVGEGSLLQLANDVLKAANAKIGKSSSKNVSIKSSGSSDKTNVGSKLTKKVKISKGVKL